MFLAAGQYASAFKVLEEARRNDKAIADPWIWKAALQHADTPEGSSVLPMPLCLSWQFFTASMPTERGCLDTAIAFPVP